MNNKYETVEDFVADESFQNFVLNENLSDVNKWESYIKLHPAKLELIDQSKFFVELLTPTVISSVESVSTPVRQKKPFILWAAMTVGFLVLLYVIYSFIFSTSQKPPVKIIQKAELENISFILPDESKIDLRRGGQISYFEDWSNLDTRKVELQGEAYFDVKNDKQSKPFQVEFNNGLITVLGTKFLTRSIKDSSLIILEEGKVSCVIEDQNFIIKPGDVLEYTKDKVSIEHHLEVRKYDSWRQRSLAFKNVSIEEIIQTINNSYLLNVELGNNKLKNRKVTATVDENDPLLLLNALAAIYDIEIIEKGDKLILK